VDEVGLKALTAQEGAQQVCEFYVVIDDEGPHGFSVTRSAAISLQCDEKF
jgi:hypothetical protein